MLRPVSRHDATLLAGLAGALLVLFSGPLGEVLDVAWQIDRGRGLQLIPALVILTAVFIFDQQRKRHEARAAALAAAAAAAQATSRAAEMERLVAFGQALARVLDQDAIRVAAAEYLPQILPDRVSWALVRTGSGWAPLTQAAEDVARAREAAASAAVAASGATAPRGADVVFPMIAGGEPVGVLGVAAEPPLSEPQRGILAAAAALLGVALKNAELFREVREYSIRDALTGCVNRRHGLEVMHVELRRARRSRLPLAALMFDLDQFKTVNDRYGHLCGDAVLAAVGQRMHAVLRGSDTKCRYGGEEFLVLLPDTPGAGARRVAETLRREIATQPVLWQDTSIAVTASFGIAAVDPGELDVTAVIARADAALYRAKQAGRNCVREAAPESANV